MAIPFDLQVLAPFSVLSITVIWTGIFDQSYTSSGSVLKELEGSTATNIWTFVCYFFMAACFWRVYEAWKYSNQVKITRVDVYFVSVLNGLALLQFAAHFLNYQSHFEPAKNVTTILRMSAMQDWSMLPFLAWNVSWSRHVRRGWTPWHNWMMCGLASISYFLTLIHRTSFFFLLGIAVTLSGIAVYETYKIHFYRAGIKPLFYVILSLHLIFYTASLLDFIILDFGWIFTYLSVTAFALMTALTNRLYIKILKEVNEHKY
uniref:Uncharacterized LOC100181757 n=1 Tax=Ciona intestinalis TaxID=7719 RepID=F6PMS1_CIOIN|nr:uncharacterized protein LOC100181757 [Ciona intestinalis]|eukprot:XP_002128085.1 uncharacterized protein LOC100181757 [Ciona intestinalis]